MQKKEQKEWFSEKLVCGRKLCNEVGPQELRSLRWIFGLSESCLQIVILVGFSAR